MSPHRLAPLALALLAIPVAACGGDDPAGGGDDDPVDARAVDALPPPRDGGPPDGPPPAATILSNLPGLTWQADPSSLPGLAIVSSNFVQENLSGSIYQHWYAEIRNDSSVLVCYPEVALQLKDAAGVVLATMDMFADTPPYKGVSTVSSSCIAPGATAAVYAIENPSAPPPGTPRVAAWKITGLTDTTAVPHPAAPAVTGSVYERLTGYWAVQGTVEARQGIRNIGMDVYPIGPAGWIVARLGATNLGSLAPGASWAYQTTGYRGERYTTYRQYVSFIEGTSATRTAPADPALAEREAAAQAAFAARRARIAARDAAAR